MEELNPVAWKIENPEGEIVTDSPAYVDTFEGRGDIKVTPLYAIPDGYVVVPVEPTKAMIDAMCDVIAYCGPESDYFDDAVSAYKAMLAGATFPRGSVVDEEV